MNSDRLAAIVLLAIAALYMLEARSFRAIAVSDVVGPSRYPLLLGGTLALLAVLLFLQASRSRSQERFGRRHGRAVVFAGSLFAYIMALEPVGFLGSTFAFLALSHRWLGEGRWPRAILIALGVTVALWLLFDRVLDIRLPLGAIRWPP